MIKKIFNYSLLFFFSLILIYSFKNYFGQSNYEIKQQYLLYSLISFLIVLLIFLSTFFSKKIFFTYLNISIISILFSCYLFESFLILKEILNKNKIYSEFYEKNGKKYDFRFFTEVYFELKKKDKNISSASTTPNHFLKENELKIFPLSGVSYSKTINCNENGYYSFFQSDRFGFNNPDQIWDLKEIDLVLVGDSFVLGNCVNYPDDISSVLNKQMITLNLGYAGNGPLIQLASLIEYYPKKSGNVIWFFFEGNDMSDLKIEKKNEILLKYLNDVGFQQKLKEKQGLVNSLIENKISKRMSDEQNSYEIEKKITFKLKKFFKLSEMRKQIFNSIYLKKNFSNEEFIFFEKIIKYAKDLSEKNKSKFYFVYLPDLSRYKLGLNNNTYEKIQEIVNRNNINFIDIKSSVFDKEQYPENLFPFRSRGHYNVEGYFKVSNQIIEILNKNDKSEK